MAEEVGIDWGAGLFVIFFLAVGLVLLFFYFAWCEEAKVRKRLRERRKRIG
jgi:ABC-type uncharacterized transport system permease subunit